MDQQSFKSQCISIE